MTTALSPAPITCPACGMVNGPDAVFCAAHGCHKALGEFGYVAEAIAARSTQLEQLADRVARFTAHPHFVTLHVAWFAAWMLLNSGVIAAFVVFDGYPFSLLGILLAIEAILITGFVLISQTRQNRYAEQRAELDYEVNVRSYRKLQQLETEIARLAARLGDTGRSTG